VAFSFYVDNFNTYYKLYGSIGTIIVVMLWMQINCLILLIGFELNASIAVNRDLKEEPAEEGLIGCYSSTFLVDFRPISTPFSNINW
jgi:membrane protein